MGLTPEEQERSAKNKVAALERLMKQKSFRGTVNTVLFQLCGWIKKLYYNKCLTSKSHGSELSSIPAFLEAKLKNTMLYRAKNRNVYENSK